MKNDDLFDEITREHDAMIKRIAMSHEVNPHLAEELVQDIYFAIWRALPNFRGEASLKTFVARIATNRAVTHVMRAVRSPKSIKLEDGMPAQGDDPERLAIAGDHWVKLAAAVRSLPLTYRPVALLTLEGLAPAEIAGVLGITANAVSVRLTRAKDLLREVLGEGHD